MIRAAHYLGQAAVLGLLGAFIGYFAAGPAYAPVPPDRALIKLSFSHTGAPKGECRKLTPEELAKLPRNMRKADQCPRERVPLHVELALDGRLLFRGVLPPTGLSGDGPAQLYEKFFVESGVHRIDVRLRDSARADGFDHERVEEVSLQARQVLVIDFRPESGGFIWR